MTEIKTLLKDCEEVPTTTVTVANGDILHVKGVENISFKTEHGYGIFTGVLHLSGLDRNLISVPQLTSKYLTIRMLKDKCVISGKQGHVMIVKSQSPRFPEDAKYSTQLCLWHQRFGHLASISIKGLIESLPKLDLSLEFIAAFCTGCVLGKFDRRPFCPTAKKAGSVCEKFHMDIKGPIDMISVGRMFTF